ncbi:MAG TPA: transcription elongation factor GreA [Clostridiales bacterium]|nr:transcription elongation factor GreA [Clostridiales bacterium]
MGGTTTHNTNNAHGSHSHNAHNGQKEAHHHYMTYEGLKNLEARLEELKTTVRSQIAERIKQALAFGDISENSEYDEAKNEQARVETEIAEIEAILKNVKIIDEDDVRTDIVNLGNKVRIQNIETQAEKHYMIVGSYEADPLNNRISDESPLGRAIIGKKMNAEVEVLAPSGKIRYRILEISKF